ncbi:hypothetical protein STENM36S_04338 [Streptomyces tendae]
MTEPTITQLEPMPGDWHRALAVVAHPDDLEYGCSAAIAAWTDEGREVAYVLATRGRRASTRCRPTSAPPCVNGSSGPTPPSSG